MGRLHKTALPDGKERPIGSKSDYTFPYMEKSL